MIEPVMIGTSSLYLGDCIEVMRQMPDCSVDSVVTDPPYGIRFMGKAWDGADIEERANDRRNCPTKYLEAGPNGGHNSIAAEAGKYDLSPKSMAAFQEFSREWAKEALRILKPGGYLLSFSSARTYHRMTSGIEDAGFEIRDQIMWVFGSGFPKSHNLDGDRQGWGTALKPAHEPICVARKPLIDTVAGNVLKFGTGAINIDGCRIEAEQMKPNTGKGALPRRNEAEIREASPPSQPHELGRWPANLIHDGCVEVVQLFPKEAGAFAPVKGGEPSSVTNDIYGDFNQRVPGAFYGDTGSAARFFYCAKTSKEDRDEGLDLLPLRDGGIKNESGRGFSETDPMKTVMQRNFHPTVKPTDLMRYLIRLVTPPGGIPLDPFMGSGSTGKAAWLEGFKFIGIEKEPEYFEIAKVRVKAKPAQDRLFG